MSKLDKEQVIEKFTAAYKAAKGKAPKLEAKGGWYSVDGGKNMRLAQLEELADSLSADKKTKAPAAKAEKAVEKKAAPAKEKAKPAAKKAAAPAKAKKAKKAKSSDFSVKAMWAEQLTNKDHQCRLPR
ncbi:hypothetical protein [Lacimicrobium alkaliphilum]|mgnify:CR=1 FL=1|uniref:Uncharacterized protein n=1 Tax=Lacimicrobium alkaliphilum TaxID=1526571 RepID=A0A0U2PG90_9ALTE|nr:hypothetical protein [Lacimicrobium alkaliphilum]ALS98413.1 hypothetical protein AT746_09180 [Lacimicrobium alkaliphilum]